MEIIEVKLSEFDHGSLDLITPFHTGMFSELHKKKFDRIYYLHFVDSRIRLGLIFGVLDNCALSPYSAPFGGWVLNKKSCTLEHFYLATELLDKFAKEKKWKRIRFTIPPHFYDPKLATYSISALVANNYKILHTDVNYHFETINIDDNYTGKIWRNAKKNLNIAKKNPFDFKEACSKSEKMEVYSIIQKNRQQRGYPLKLSFLQLIENTNLINIDFLSLKLYSLIIAGAIVFRLSEKVAMVVYWGDDIEKSEYRAMNLLSYSVFNYYKDKQVDIVDIGPSSEDGKPNYGLCDFKDSIGCSPSLKWTLAKTINYE